MNRIPMGALSPQRLPAIVSGASSAAGAPSPDSRVDAFARPLFRS
jgi:hypothetical protein